MDGIEGNLWEFNFCRVVILDVTDDYRLMQPPLPNECYPVLTELWLPRHNLKRSLVDATLVDGYLYDWHQSPPDEEGRWYVGVVDQHLASQLHL